MKEAWRAAPQPEHSKREKLQCGDALERERGAKGPKSERKPRQRNRETSRERWLSRRLRRAQSHGVLTDPDRGSYCAAWRLTMKTGRRACRLRLFLPL